MWTYEQAEGVLFHDGKYVGQGYSGHAEGRNNPAEENTKSIGPIPRGKYVIGRSYKHPNLGPVTMNLDPVGHDALGRTDFRIHGDNIQGDASHGCIIMSRPIRKEVSESGDTELTVV